HLAGDLSYTDLSEKAIIATRQMAKRQLTWLRAQKEAYWFDSLSPNLKQQVLKLWEKIHISEQLSVISYQGTVISEQLSLLKDLEIQKNNFTPRGHNKGSPLKLFF
ncbi:MAG: hypothetical protein VSS75_003745, partial [Candidatus Parabeggiatoa sp.]|nr:hypothetical protein [Candidatus Parabeggiatoa sp.]